MSILDDFYATPSFRNLQWCSKQPIPKVDYFASAAALLSPTSLILHPDLNLTFDFRRAL